LSPAKFAVRVIEQLEIRITQLLKESFLQQAFFIDCMLSSEDNSFRCRALIDTGATGYAFLNQKLARVLCDTLGIEPQALSRPKEVKAFNGKSSKQITHGVYPHMTVAGHSELTAPMLITNLGNHDMILSYSWMKKHDVTIDCVKDRIHFKPDHCDHSLLDCDLDRIKETSGVSSSEGEVKLPVKQMLQRKSKSSASQSSVVEPKLTAVNSGHKPVFESLTSAKIDICMIEAAAFLTNTLTKHNGRVFAASIKEINELLSWQKRHSGQELTISNINDEVDPTNEMNLKELIPKEYHDLMNVFKEKKLNELPSHRSYDHRIEVEQPIELSTCPLYSMSPYKLQKVKEYIEENLSKEFICPSSASYASPILFVQKKDEGMRFCVDYRKLNSLSKKNPYSIPLIQEIMAQLIGKKYFSRFDIVAAFNNLRMHSDSEEYTTFKTTFGLYMYKVLPFELTGGPGTWQHYMNDVLFEFLEKFCFVYLDDILVFSDTKKEHQAHVRSVLERLQAVGLQVNIRKSEFHVQETKFLGVLVGVDGLRMNPEKVSAIVNWSIPRTTKQVLSFLGFCNFYRRFIKDFARIADPLTQLTKKDRLFVWSEACQQAFEGLKNQVISAPALRHFDPRKPSYLETDSSDYVTGGVLSQYDDEEVLHSVAFYSHKMIPAECNYEIYDKELLAILKAFENWRPELEGSAIPVTILTNHRGLEYFQTKRTLTRRQARWAEKLSEFHFVIRYRDGKSNQKADALTRQSDSISTDPEDERILYQNKALLTPEQFVTVASAELEEMTLHDFIKERIVIDEDGQAIVRAVQDQARKVKTSRGILQLQDAKVEDDLI